MWRLFSAFSLVLDCLGLWPKWQPLKCLKKKEKQNIKYWTLIFPYSPEKSFPNMSTLLLKSVCIHPHTYAYLHSVCTLVRTPCAHRCTVMNTPVQSICAHQQLWVYSYRACSLTYALMSTYKGPVHTNTLVTTCKKDVYMHGFVGVTILMCPHWYTSEYILTVCSHIYKCK